MVRMEKSFTRIITAAVILLVVVSVFAGIDVNAETKPMEEGKEDQQRGIQEL